MEGEEIAESTLRGRYRSLTKERKDRVRKPVWTKVDVSHPGRFCEQATNTHVDSAVERNRPAGVQSHREQPPEPALIELRPEAYQGPLEEGC
jgi:hypothetical protein